MLLFLLLAVAGFYYLSYGVAMENMKQQQTSLQQQKQQPKTPVKVKSQTNNNEAINSQQKTKGKSPPPINHDKCAFRSYPSNRLYGLSSKSQSKFLSEAAYIRGQWPIVINPIENDNKIIQAAAGGVVTNNSQQTSPVKVCIDTTSWEDLIGDAKDGKERLPFTDGHNPSVISLAPNPYNSERKQQQQQQQQQHMRLDPKHLEPIVSAFPSLSLESLFLGVTIFGGGQCKFGLSPSEVDDYRFSLYDEPPGGKRAVIVLLAPPNNLPNGDDDNPSSSNPQHSPFQTLAQTTLLLERDVDYGSTRKKRAIRPERTSSGGFARIHQEFDDPRLFFHRGRVWVLYRNGPLFGYTDQIHNPIHFEKVVQSSSGEDGGTVGGDVTFVAYVKASETVRVGGGRNIALISEEPLGRNEHSGEVEWAASPSLKALTWVDPVTVREDVDLREVEAKLLLKSSSSRRRRLLEEEAVVDNGNNGSNGEHITIADPVTMTANSFFHQSSSRPSSVVESHHHHHTQQHRRRLGSKSKPTKSNVHGTNGYMVPLPSTGELLGIAHFHRPEDRKQSEFALHGHHYTHAFFTIARRQSDDSTKDVRLRPFKLKRLSNEFVFRSNSLPVGETQLPRDGDVIQFASGLDVVGSDIDGQLILSYGINDCEGAVFTLTMENVQRMLVEVDPGQEVVDLMEYIQQR